MDLYGSSDEKTYQELEELYHIYCTIGGYPAVVLAYMETGSLPAFRDTAATVTAQPIQRKKEGYMPMERKPAAQTQEPEPQV